MVVIVQKWLYLEKVVVFKKNNCISAKGVIFGQISCIPAKRLYFGKVVVFGQKWL